MLVYSYFFCLRNSLKSTPLVIVESADNSIDSEKAATSIDPMSETEPHGEYNFFGL